MQNALVRYSRAGDAFHYRWAARRCLRLIDSNSGVDTITVEASKEKQGAAEYVIDLAEYSSLKGQRQRIDYYQLKHSTVRAVAEMTLAALKDIRRIGRLDYLHNLRTGAEEHDQAV